MGRRDIAVYCAFCGADGWRSAFAWLAHEDVCRACMDRMVAEGHAVVRDGALHDLTPAGEDAHPHLQAVAECAWCATPVYRRWLDAGQACLEPHPTCHFCHVERAAPR